MLFQFVIVSGIQASADSRIYRPINIFFNNRPSVQAPIFLQKIGLFFKHETRSPRAFSIAHKNILEHKQARILFKTNVLSVGVIQVQITLYNLYNHFNSLGCINQLPFGNQRESRSMSVLNMFFFVYFLKCRGIVGTLNLQVQKFANLIFADPQ